MTVIFYLHHPAHFHLFKHVITVLKNRNHDIIILATKKDVLENLLRDNCFDYINMLPKGRKDDLISIALGLLKQDLGLLKICIEKKPDLMVGTSTEITHIGRLLKIPSIFVNEDDVEAIPLVGKLAYPYAHLLLVPTVCSVGKFEYKKIGYNGYHELNYLHPKYFIPDRSIINNLTDRKYFILRFAKLTAHHDQGKKGITTSIAEEIIKLLALHGTIYITAERTLEQKFQKHQINISPSLIHHVLFYADMYIGDSQTMAAEAAVLGTPSLRFNDFVGKLGYLEELENKYGLTYGIKTDQPEKLLQKVDEILKMPDAKTEWAFRREKMLKEKINVTDFMVWLIENYPSSVKTMRENPDYQYNFK